MRPTLTGILETSQGWLQKHREDVNDVLGPIQVCQLSLLPLSLSLLHGKLVLQFLSSNDAHFLGIAVLGVERVEGFEESVTGKLLGKSAVILLVKVHESLLSARNDLDLGDFASAACLEVDFEFLFSGTWREVLDEKAEQHDRLLVLEVVDGQLISPLLLGFRLATVKLRSPITNLLVFKLVIFCRLLSRCWVVEADESKALGSTFSVSHDTGILYVTVLLEKLCQLLVLEIGIFGEVLDVDIVEGSPALLHLRTLVLDHRKNALIVVAVRLQVVLVHLQIFTIRKSSKNLRIRLPFEPLRSC